MRRGPFLVLFAVSGAAALIYEVVWTRQLTLTMGHGLAAASAVLAAFMGGLAVGAGAAGRHGRHQGRRGRGGARQGPQEVQGDPFGRQQASGGP